MNIEKNKGGRPAKFSPEEAKAALSALAPAQLAEVRVQVEFRNEDHESPLQWDSNAGRGYLRLNDNLVVPSPEVLKILLELNVPLPSRLDNRFKRFLVFSPKHFPTEYSALIADIGTEVDRRHTGWVAKQAAAAPAKAPEPIKPTPPAVAPVPAPAPTPVPVPAATTTPAPKAPAPTIPIPATAPAQKTNPAPAAAKATTNPVAKPTKWKPRVAGAVFAATVVVILVAAAIFVMRPKASPPSLLDLALENMPQRPIGSEGFEIVGSAYALALLVDRDWTHARLRNPQAQLLADKVIGSKKIEESMVVLAHLDQLAVLKLKVGKRVLTLGVAEGKQDIDPAFQFLVELSDLDTIRKMESKKSGKLLWPSARVIVTKVSSQVLVSCNSYNFG